LAIDAGARIADSAQMYAEIESHLRESGKMEGVALRYGFFYGPKTWYCQEGAGADQVRRQEIPIVGRGEGVWSWVLSGSSNEKAKSTFGFLPRPLQWLGR